MLHKIVIINKNVQLIRSKTEGISKVVQVSVISPQRGYVMIAMYPITAATDTAISITGEQQIHIQSSVVKYVYILIENKSGIENAINELLINAVIMKIIFRKKLLLFNKMTLLIISIIKKAKKVV